MSSVLVIGSIFSALPIFTSGIQRAQLKCAQFVFPGLEEWGEGR